MADKFSFETVAANGVELHCATCGHQDNPLFLFLHGFPEYWAGWSQVMVHLADRYFCVAPDQRGYNLSSKPEGARNYAARHLVEDIFQLGRHFSPDRKYLLAGHDWGASVAYAFAMRHRDQIERLVIANGVHPGPFQTALLNDAAQIEASQYFHLLRDPKAERVLSADGYARLFNMLSGFSEVAFLDEMTKSGYRDAWDKPGALTGMVNWYRASPIYVPVSGQEPDASRALAIDPERLQVSMPHLLIHGVEDRALRPAAFAGIDTFAPNTDVFEVQGAGHWILHEKPELVAARMLEWLRA